MGLGTILLIVLILMLLAPFQDGDTTEIGAMVPAAAWGWCW